jgi:malate dehydrogenase (oxaloacetate-decarboxylating)(NADP+)
MMVGVGDAGAHVSGVNRSYPGAIRPALQIIGKTENVHRVAGTYIMIVRDKVYFFADRTVNIEPSAEELADIACMAADEPVVSMWSRELPCSAFPTLAARSTPRRKGVRRAVEIVRQRRPELAIDGEMMANTAVVPEIVDGLYPFSQVRDANVLVFPNLAAANVACKLMQRLGNAEAIGPVLMGMNKPVHVLQRGDELRETINITALAVADAQDQVDGG